MPYCEGRESAIITYQFKDGNKETVRIENTPIEVSVSQIMQSGLDGADLNVYYWIFGTVRVLHGGVEKTILWKSSGRVIGPLNSYTSGYNAHFNNEIIFNDDGGKRVLLDEVDEQGNYTGYFGISGYPESVIITHTESETADAVCELKVSYDGKLIFRDTGKCPGNFEVSCDGCPPGHLKCPSTNYPGYCCIPCKEIRAELAGMRLYASQLNDKPVGK